MRQLVNLAERKEYRDITDISLAIQRTRGNVVEEEVTSAGVSNMFDGEIRIDKRNNFPVLKVNGEIKKLKLDDNNNIVLEDI